MASLRPATAERDRRDGDDQRRTVRSAQSARGDAREETEALHAGVGNQAIQALAERGRLAGGAGGTRSDEPAEREAERVASALTDDSAAAAGRARIGARPPTIDRSPDGTDPPAAADAVERGLDSPGGGRQLPTDVRERLEPRFGADFGDVRVHADREAAALADRLGAEAFTYGSDVYFGAGAYRPETTAGQELLAHELTHVVQQTATGAARTVQRQLQESRAEGPSTAERPAAFDRSWLIERIAFRMGIAFTKYVDACAEHQRRLREIAAAKAEMAGLVLDVLLGFATPGLGRLLSRAVAGAVPRDAPLAVYRAAVGVMDRSDQIVGGVTTVAKHAAKEGLKSALQRRESEAFVQTLKQEFSVVLDQVHASLPSLSDEELALLYVNFDPSIATFDAYEQQIGRLVSRYEAQVEPIGTGELQMSPYHALQTEVRAFWIELPHGTYLGLVEAVEMSYPFDRKPEFVGWVGKSMADLAIQKTREVTGREPQHISWRAVEGLRGHSSFREAVRLGRPPVTSE